MDFILTCTIILISLAVLSFIIKRYIYFQPSIEYIPSTRQFEDIWVGDLHGWFSPGDPPLGKIVVVFHGNGGNVTFCQKLLDSLNSIGMSAIVFDYPGYGRSKGVPSEQGMYRAASMVIEYVLKTYPVEDVVLYGISMGAAVATHTAVSYNIPTLILEAPLPSIRLYMESIFSPLKYLGFIFSEFDTERYLTAYRGRSLLMHSKFDEIITSSSVTGLKKHATLVVNILGTHNSPVIPWEEVRNFIIKDTNPV